MSEETCAFVLSGIQCVLIVAVVLLAMVGVYTIINWLMSHL